MIILSLYNFILFDNKNQTKNGLSQKQYIFITQVNEMACHKKQYIFIIQGKNQVHVIEINLKKLDLFLKINQKHRVHIKIT